MAFLEGEHFATIWIQCALRVVLLCAVPLLAVLSHTNPGILVILMSAVVATVDAVLSLCCRRQGKGKVGRNPLSMQSFFMLLSIMYIVQLCCLPLGGQHQPPNEGTDYYVSRQNIGDSSSFQLDVKPEELMWSPKTVSVILPCAGEEDYALKTVESVFTNTPPKILHEIIVVDDGSEPPLAQTHLKPPIQAKYKVKMMRHPQTIGLIGAKKTGGDAATGDILIFFDCHVAPQPGWYNSFLFQIGENYRRMVVPQITALDVGTWQQSSGGGVAKCYLTWDADFKWFDSDDKYIAVISGGLLGMSRRWWHETGGYDAEMFGWGGENLDQSLRVWLCGGEIIMAADSQVAHMWRTGDPRTVARYQRVGDTMRNRARAVYGWYGEFAAKLRHYPGMQRSPALNGLPWYGNLSTFAQVKRGCGGGRPFAWFLRRFRQLYEDGGMVPVEIFKLREEKSGKCLRFDGVAGTSGSGFGQARLDECGNGDDRLFWHLGNRNPREDGKCCSGLRAWNTDQCIVSAQDGTVATAVCDVAGRRPNQFWSLNAEGFLSRGYSCLGTQSGGGIEEAPCVGFRVHGKPAWSMLERQMPLETQLYRKAQREHPHLFGTLGVQHAALERRSLPVKCRGSSKCVTLTLKQGTERCFDEHGLLTSAKAFCSQYVISLQPHSSSSWQLVHAETDQCLDQMSDDDLETWGLYTCHGREMQRFQALEHEKKFCASSLDKTSICFEATPVQAQTMLAK